MSSSRRPARKNRSVHGVHEDFEYRNNAEIDVRRWLFKAFFYNTIMPMTTPLYAAILIGGKSRRMGEPKHLLTASPPSLSSASLTTGESPPSSQLIQPSTWLERTISLLRPHTAQTVIVGAGTIPDSCAGLTRLDDIAGTQGPLAGILAAMRFSPHSDWLIVACDMPAVSPQSLTWLLEQREILRNGLGNSLECWGIVPKLSDDGYVEPLFALYFHQAKTLFERQYRRGKRKISIAAQCPQIATPTVPAELRMAWQNINTPQQLSSFMHS